MEQRWTNKVEIEDANWEYELGEGYRGQCVFYWQEQTVMTMKRREQETDVCLGHTTWLDCLILPALSL